MVPQLEEDLLHLERSRDGLNKHGCAHSSLGEPNIGLGEDKDVIPEAGLEVVLHLREVEVGSETALDELLGIVVEEDGEIEDGS